MDDLPRLDGHAHVWDRSCTFVEDSRYRPDYEATVDTYLKVLDAHDVEQALLVQPSFLGTDNRYLLAALRAYPDRFRGIVVLDPTVSDQEMDDLSGTGVIGHRLNLLSLDPLAVASGPYRALIERATLRTWWTEIQAPGRVWPGIAEQMMDQGALVMADHFGLPDSADCPGISALRRLDAARVCLKFSAPYRQTSPDFLAAAKRLVTERNRPQIVWGSDWPWTQHEGRHRYRDCMDWLRGWADGELLKDIVTSDIAPGFPPDDAASAR